MVARLFRSNRRRVGAAVLGLLFVLGVAGYAGRGQLPGLMANSADVLRGVIGDQAVAQLESLVYNTQDKLNQSAYNLGADQPAAPWSTSAPPAGDGQAPLTPTPALANGAVTPSPAPNGSGNGLASSNSLGSPTSPPAGAATAVPGPTATAWPPPLVAAPGMPLPALEALPGAGQWSPYLYGSSGQVIAARTFLQPDTQRQYAVVAVVAFNLSLSRLHFVLGTNEPYSEVPITRTGLIPYQDNQPGVLLATFNGGFKARHGHSGAMVDGITVLPPRPGFATVAMYADGHVAIGSWGVTMKETPDMLAWRQNGPLIIQDGQINPHTLDAAPQDWGYSLDGNTTVWRSGLGLSADGQTLYYVAGPHLTMPALATALAATGSTQAMQLDINNFWVHFDAIQAAGNKLQAVPLVDGMNNGVGRYLEGYSRDFFYITANAQ
jgi:hypothetical protein